MGILKRKKEVRKSLLTYGVCGVENGVGTTHMCILISNFISERYGRKTAVCELNRSGDFARIEADFHKMAVPDYSEGYFRIKKTDYYKEADSKTLTDIFSKGYECVVIDFGKINPVECEEYERCTKKIVVTGSAPWNKIKFYDFCNIILKEQDKRKYIFSCVHMDKELRQDLKRQFGVSIHRIGFEPDPYAINRETAMSLMEII